MSVKECCQVKKKHLLSACYVYSTALSPGSVCRDLVRTRRKKKSWLRHGPCRWITHVLISYNSLFFLTYLVRCCFNRADRFDIWDDLFFWSSHSLGFTLLISGRWMFGNREICASVFQRGWTCLLAFPLITHQLFLLPPICLLYRSQRLVRPTQLLYVMQPSSPVHGAASSTKYCSWWSLP